MKQTANEQRAIVGLLSEAYGFELTTEAELATRQQRKKKGG